VVDLATMPDIEDLLTAHLVVGDPAVPVTTKTPNDDWDGDPVPDSFVRVERVGGVKQSPISDLPNVVAEAWARDESAAAALMGELRHALDSLRGTVLGSSKVNGVAEIGGVQQLPDPTGQYERYTVTVSIHIRGAIA
jgi:hypothetical protein